MSISFPLIESVKVTLGARDDQLYTFSTFKLLGMNNR